MNGTEWEGQESNCCGATIINCDICSDCKEHCEPQELSATWSNQKAEIKLIPREKVKFRSESYIHEQIAQYFVEHEASKREIIENHETWEAGCGMFATIRANRKDNEVAGTLSISEECVWTVKK